MTETKDKPTEKQRGWFKWVEEEIQRLDPMIKAGLQRKDRLNQTLDLIDDKSGVGDDKVDTRNLVASRDEQIIKTQRLINLKGTLERQKSLSGICSQCGGTGHHDPFQALRSGGQILNEPTPTCGKCWGSGWENAPSPSPFEDLRVEDFVLKDK